MIEPFRHRFDPIGEEFVGTAHDRILFVQDRWHVELRGGKHGRNRGIAAKSNQRARLGGPDDLSRGLRASDQGYNRTGAGKDGSTAGGCCRYVVDGPRRKSRTIAARAVVRDQFHGEAARNQGFTQRLGREEMASGPARGNHDRTLGHAAGSNRPASCLGLWCSIAFGSVPCRSLS